MKKNIILSTLFFLFCCVCLQAQVTIGSDMEPHESAVLDIKSNENNKGFLGPRVTLTRRDVTSPVANPATGLLVLNTADSPANIPDNLKVRANKYYYWSGSEWIEFIDQYQLDNTISEELDKLGIPRIAFFQLMGEENISTTGTAKYGIKDFMKGIRTGYRKDVPLKEVANHTNGAVSLSTRVVSGQTQYEVTFEPGIYNILFSYEFAPVSTPSSPLPDCTLSSYFMDFPLDPTTGSGDRARIHSNASHSTKAQGDHGGSISYVVKLDSRTTWPVKLGTGQAGNCTENINGYAQGIGGYAICNNGTLLSILRIDK